jgi:hypothetical protein
MAERFDDIRVCGVAYGIRSMRKKRPFQEIKNAAS